MATVPDGITSIHLQEGRDGYDFVPDYRTLPRSVTTLRIDDVGFASERHSLPPWLQSLSLVNSREEHFLGGFPPELESLNILSYTLKVLDGLPASLRNLTLRGCEGLERIGPLPPVMDSIEISACSELRDFGFFPSESVRVLGLSDLSQDVALDKLPAEIGNLIIEFCPRITTLSESTRVTGYLWMRESHGDALTRLMSSVKDLRLKAYDLERETIPPSVKHLTLNQCSFETRQLPVGLESLTIVDCYPDDLIGLPEDLVSLKLIRLGGLESFAGIPPCLQHLVIKEVDGPEDFPRLAYLDSVEIDRVVTKDGTEYTDGESYLADSKCRAKSAQAPLS